MLGRSQTDLWGARRGFVGRCHQAVPVRRSRDDSSCSHAHFLRTSSLQSCRTSHGRRELASGGSLPDQPGLQLTVIRQCDELHQAPVVRVVRSMQEVIVPVLRVLAEHENHLVQRPIEGRSVSSKR